MSRNVRISAVMIAAFVAVLAAVAIASGGDENRSEGGAASTPSPSPTATQGATTDTRVVASDARRLGSAGRGGVTFTEFLDFECEACGAAFPAIEQLRREYAGRVTFNIRYFPLDSHQNARNAALAVEAAARQGKLEAMYRRMYETQTAWGEQQDSKADVFRGFAEQLGLDLDAYDAAIRDPATAARVQRDSETGLALGVQATPTFFVNERRLEPESFDDLRRELDTALKGS